MNLAPLISTKYEKPHAKTPWFREVFQRGHTSECRQSHGKTTIYYFILRRLRHYLLLLLCALYYVLCTMHYALCTMLDLHATRYSFMVHSFHKALASAERWATSMYEVVGCWGAQGRMEDGGGWRKRWWRDNVPFFHCRSSCFSSLEPLLIIHVLGFSRQDSSYS